MSQAKKGGGSKMATGKGRFKRVRTEQARRAAQAARQKRDDKQAASLLNYSSGTFNHEAYTSEQRRIRDTEYLRESLRGQTGRHETRKEPVWEQTPQEIAETMRRAGVTDTHGRVKMVVQMPGSKVTLNVSATERPIPRKGHLNWSIGPEAKMAKRVNTKPEYDPTKADQNRDVQKRPYIGDTHGKLRFKHPDEKTVE